MSNSELKVASGGGLVFPKLPSPHPISCLSVQFTLFFFKQFQYRGEFDREDEDPEYKPTRTPFKDEIDVRTRVY